MEGKISVDTEVGAAELAVVLGVTKRRVQQMIDDGLLDTVSRGRLNLSDSVQRYIRFKANGEMDEKERAERKASEKAQMAAQTVLKTSKANIAKLEAAELQGKMHRSEDVAGVIEDLVYSARSMLMSLPGRVAVDAAKAKTATEAAEVVRRETYLIMEELSKYRYDPKRFEERVRERRNWDAGQAGDGDEDE